MTAASVTGKSAVNAIVTPNLADGFSSRYKTRMEVVGNSEEIATLSIFAIKTKFVYS